MRDDVSVDEDLDNFHKGTIPRVPDDTQNVHFWGKYLSQTPNSNSEHH